MSETNPVNESAPVPVPATGYYRVPKWLVWGLTAITLALLLRHCADLWSHADWPPWDGSNQEYVKSLNCGLKQDMDVTQEKLRGEPSQTHSRRIGLDRRAFIEIPECVAVGMYLHLEGSGVRHEFGVYDMTTKRLTARIVITHEKFDRK
ncbi:MAG: hypothetical protein IPP44_00215 [Ideonella sp.]|nr:hypothetical protein [Ideonella sp.]